MSSKAEQGGLGVTLLERITHRFGDSAVRMLDTQYRMNERIMQWSSSHLYDGKLKAHDSVKNQVLADVPDVKRNDDTVEPVIFVDTAGCNMPELVEDDEISRANPSEADIVVALVKKLVADGVKISNIGIITPYNMQVELLQRTLVDFLPQLEIKSVDGFQVWQRNGVLKLL